LLGRRWRVVLSPAHLAGVPLLCAACAAWPLALYGAEGESGMRAFVLNNGLYRVVPGAPEYLGGHEQPFWYYLTRLPDQVGWVALFVPATAAWLLRGEAASSFCLPALRFLGGVLAVGALLLTIPGTKRGLYLLPFQPPLAVAIGAWVAAVGSSDAHRSRIERGVASFCARLVREDPSRAAAGACRGPYRVLGIAFAISVACYLFVYPFFANRDRNLEPMARDVSARVGGHPLVGLRLEEGIRGAFAFYAGRIVPSVQDPQDLAQSFEPSGSGYVLAPLWMQEPIDAALGRSVAIAGTWRGAHNDFSLYALSPPQSLAGAGSKAE
jgi:hypothetical protein